MSVLDQAIVKAYGKLAAGTRGSVAGRPAAVSRAAPSVASPEILYRPEWVSPSQTDSVVPAPHIDFRLASSPPAKEKSIESRIDSPHVAAAPLRAAFEVETFIWPEVVQQMADTQEAAFAPLLAELGELSVRGRKLVAISGCRAGTGATTLLLALAQLLGKREVSTAVVDLEFWHPRLAGQLGIAPQIGWHEVLPGDQPLTEALVESLKDQVTLMPLCESIATDPLAEPARLANLLRTLSQGFDLVLLNVGLDANPGPHTPAPPLDVVAWLGKLQVDFALLVRDARKTNADEALALGQRLQAAGVRQWHLAENYASLNERADEPIAAAMPVAPPRVAPGPPDTVMRNAAPVASPAAGKSSVRPVAVASISKSHEAAADWQPTVVPPWKN